MITAEIRELATQRDRLYEQIHMNTRFAEELEDMAKKKRAVIAGLQKQANDLSFQIQQAWNSIATPLTQSSGGSSSHQRDIPFPPSKFDLVGPPVLKGKEARERQEAEDQARDDAVNFCHYCGNGKPCDCGIDRSSPFLEDEPCHPIEGCDLGLTTVPGCEHPDFSHYYDWEQNVAKPALEAAGYTDIRFYSEDADSFGPLVRGVSCRDTSGNTVKFFYG